MLLKRRRFAALWLALPGALAARGTLAADGAALSDADAAQVHDAVQGQLDALARDDAEKAFSFAAPNVRNRLGSADRFLAMVRSGYPVVYRHTSADFMVPQRLHDGTVVQRLRMTDTAGQSWLATYTLRQQPNRVWLISGCDIQPSRRRST